MSGGLKTNMRVTILGHASLFFETAEERVLLDPVLRTTSLMGSLVHQYPRALDVGRMPKPTLIVVTHAHFDHYDLETLGGLPKDVPVLIPPDRRMARKLGELGFAELHHLDTWESLQHGSLRLVATPSDAPVTEFGLLVSTENARLWHMSDAEPPPDAAARILSEQGPVDVVSAKFQPADPQLNFHHNMGASFDRRAVATWLEIACACAPKLAFPYASGLCFSGERTWLNRYAYPFSAEFVAHVLGQRLAGAGEATVMRPGDVISINGQGARVERQASPFVRQAGHEADIEWEPFDDGRLPGLADDERGRFEEELARVVLGSEFGEWLSKHSSGDSPLLKSFREWRALCQLVVHMGGGQRSYFQIDFAGESPEIRRGQTAFANYFTHIGADAARRLLSGESPPLEVMLEGSTYIYERLVTVRDGRLDAPATTRLYEEFPDPLLSFGRTRLAARK